MRAVGSTWLALAFESLVANKALQCDVLAFGEAAPERRR
jgi:hypothetical protein